MKWREMTKEQKHQWVFAQVTRMEDMKKTLDELVEVFSQWGAGIAGASKMQEKK